MPFATAALRLSTPILLLVAVAVLWPRIVENASMLAGLPGVGPAGWPRFMLGAIGVCAALWLAREIVILARGPKQASIADEDEHPPTADEEEDSSYSYSRALVGLAVIIAYGAALPYLGFPVATLGFMLAWCILGNVRRPIVLLPVSVIGTTALIYLFVGLATMPLNRGVGIFDAFTISLYQFLGIY